MTEPASKMAGDEITSAWANSTKALVEDLPDQIGGIDYLVYKKDATFYAEGLRSGLADYTGSNAFTVVQAAINALPSGGGKLQFATGRYVFTSPLIINKNSVHLMGQNAGGDLYFTNDDTYHGFTNKIATVFVADGIDAIRIGESAFVFGTAVENIGITGKDSDAVMDNALYSSGAGIRVWKGNTFSFKNVEVQRKDKGIHFQTEGAFAWDNVIDVVNMSDLYFCYNRYGLYQRNWVANVRIRNLYGYVNQLSLLNAVPQYDWVIDGVSSQVDGWNSTDLYDTPIYLGTRRDVTLQNVTVCGKLDGLETQKSLMFLWGDRKTAEVEGTGAYIKLQNVILAFCKTHAISVDGTGDLLEINNLNVGVHNFYSETPTISGSVLWIYDTSTMQARVTGGWVNCTEANKFRFDNGWFHADGVNKVIVRNVKGFNPAGLISVPWNNVQWTAGLNGDDVFTLQPSHNYVANGTDLIVNSSGGTGVNITVKDPAGNTIVSGLATLNAQYLPVGYIINFGAFSVAPTGIVCGV